MDHLVKSMVLSGLPENEYFIKIIGFDGNLSIKAENGVVQPNYLYLNVGYFASEHAFNSGTQPILRTRYAVPIENVDMSVIASTLYQYLQSLPEFSA